MKKIIFYIPVIIFIIFYGWACFILEVGFISKDSVFFVGSFFVAGVLLSKNIFCGCLIGILPSICSIYGSIKGTYLGIEIPLGTIVFIYYILCGYYIYRKKSIL